MGLATSDNIRPLPAGAGLRDRRLDFWRGLCLVDMVIVHLAYAEVQFGDLLNSVFQYYLRFAAGGFVMISGLCVGAIFFPRVQAAGDDAPARWEVYQRLWRRALVVLLIHYGVVLVWIMLAACRQSVAPPDLANFHDLNVNFPRRLLNIALLRDGGDLLPLYVYMLALTPLILALMRRRLHWLIVLASIAIFVVGLQHPYWLAPNKQDPSDPGRGTFPPLLWQMVFITGLLAPPALRAFDALTLSRKLLAGAIALVVAVVVFLDANWQYMGLPASPVAFLLHGKLTYVKVPLSVGEYLRYMTLMMIIMISTALVWRHIAKSWPVTWCALLGRHSLMIYVTHLFLQEAIVTLVCRYQPNSVWWGLSVPASLAVLLMLAWSVEKWKKRQLAHAGAPVSLQFPTALST